ncbi:hypothetical protein BD310DRAFT_798922, partial [Dichomitus squalens]
MGPTEVHEYLSHVMNSDHSKLDPLRNSVLVGGFRDGKRSLAYIDLLSTTYSA